MADIDQALAPGAPLVHPELGLESNIYHTYKIRKGSIDDGLGRAPRSIVETTYELPYQEHAYLQPEAAVSYVDDEGRVTVEVAGQWTHEDQEQIAHALDLPADRVRVIYPAIGGAFGGREDMSLQIVLALAAMRLAERGEHRPIASHWSREESIVGHHKRHRGRIHAKWGADADGKLVAVQSEAWLDAGAYNYTTNKVLGNCHLGQAGPYEVPNAHIDSHAVYTNAVPGGAFRGFGGPQAAFVAESQMNKLAEALGIDPGRDPSPQHAARRQHRDHPDRMPAGVTMPQVIDRCADEVAASTNRSRPPTRSRRSPRCRPPTATCCAGAGSPARSRTSASRSVSPNGARRRIVLHGDPDADTPESGELFHAGADVGQGAHTAFLQMAAEATGVPFEQHDGRVLRHVVVGRFGLGVGVAPHVHGRQLDPRRRRGGRQGMARG